MLRSIAVGGQSLSVVLIDARLLSTVCSVTRLKARRLWALADTRDGGSSTLFGWENPLASTEGELRVKCAGHREVRLTGSSSIRKLARRRLCPEMGVANLLNLDINNPTVRGHDIPPPSPAQLSSIPTSTFSACPGHLVLQGVFVVDDSWTLIASA